MRVLGMAVAVTAVSALVLSGGSPGVPIEWHAPTAAAGSAANDAVSPAPQASTQPVGASKPPKGAVPSQTALQELKRTSSSVVLSPQGAVTSVSGTKLATGGPDAFVHRYAAVFGLSDAQGLARVSAQTLAGGDTVTRYAQTAGGLPVLGGQIVVTSRGATVRSAQATTSLMAPAGRASVTAAAAGPIALAAATDKLKLTGLHVAQTRQWQYDPSVIGAPGTAALRPTWQVDLAGADGSDAASVLVDALDGAVRLTLSTREEARDRLICDLNSSQVDLNVRSNYACTPTSSLGTQPAARSEGEGPSSVDDVNRAYDLLGSVYDFYRSNFGVDSYDDRGAPIRATVRACDRPFPGYQNCPYPNAFWEGTQFVFGKDFVVDDVAAHEFTHAYTEYSSHLLYAYQAGAINEAISDIMGELFDQSYHGAGETEQPWLIGEDLPIGAIRSMSNPNLYGQPSCFSCQYWYGGDQDNGGVHTNSGVGNYTAYQIAGQIGNAKSLQLWWRVMHLLPSGSTYVTLGSALQIACTQLTGYYGITAADCVKVRDIAQDLYNPFGWAQSWNACPGQQPTDTLYFNGFEGSADFKASSGQWLTLPAADAQYQFAHSGHGALNGWITSTGIGNGATATMPALSLPSGGGKLFLYFARAALSHSTGTNAYLEMNVNGTGWKPTGSGGTSPISLPSADYNDLAIDISGLAGKKVQFRFRLSGTRLFDFYVDDFRVYQCLDKPSSPVASAWLNGTTGNIAIITMYNTLPGGWPTESYGYLPSGQTVDHYEYKFIPPIPGAPTSSTGPTITIPDVPPGNYLVSIRTVTNTGAASAWRGVRMSKNPPPDCQKPVYPIGWVMGRRPDACDIVRAPR
jgi:Zn-dependent metalloprotease